MPSSQKTSRRLRYLHVAILLLLVVVCNEFTVFYVVGDQLVDLPGRHRNLIYYAPWCLRVLNLYSLVLAGMLLFHAESERALWKDNLTFNTLAFVAGLLLLLFSNPIAAGQFMLLRLLWVLWLMFQLMRIAHMAWVKPLARPRLGMRPGLILFGLGMVFLVSECVFFFVARSHHTIESYASRIWHHRYWELDPGGFRDQPLFSSDLRGKQVILAIGDSFTAGAGVRDPEDRFSNRLEQLLGTGYRVVNRGVNGWGPEEELAQLESSSVQGDVLLYTWFFNDIHGAAQATGHDLQAIMPASTGHHPGLRPWELSYAINYIWWSFPHTRRDASYFDYLKAAYQDPQVMRRHEAALGGLVEHARKHNMRMAVILFPWLRDVAASRFATVPVERYFQQAEIPVLSLDAILAGYSPEELIVNANDGHPNAFTHGLVADTLAGFLKKYRVLE